MELRVLKYFLVIAQQGSFSAAARQLHVTQPTLSRQIMELEEDVGSQLLIRGKRRTTLTEAGKYLRSRAEEILELAKRTKSTLGGTAAEVFGDVYIAGGETKAMSLVARAMKKTRDSYSNIKFHIYSGNAEAVSERLDKGLADFGVFISPGNFDKYEYLTLPLKDIWGVLLRTDHPLAEKAYVTPEDFAKLDLILSAQDRITDEISGWLGENREKLNVVATYTLLYNAALMVKAGLGVAMCLDEIANTSAGSSICFRPFKPDLSVEINFAWKKNQMFSSASEKFLETMQGIVR